MDVDRVIAEMKGIGIRGIPEACSPAALALNVIKKGTKNGAAPKVGVVLFRESQERAKVMLERMSAIADQMSKVSVGLREQLREADTFLREMDSAVSEFRRIFDE